MWGAPDASLAGAEQALAAPLDLDHEPARNGPDTAGRHA
jgi:hypothetical protein